MAEGFEGPGRPKERLRPVRRTIIHGYASAPAPANDAPVRIDNDVGTGSAAPS